MPDFGVSLDSSVLIDVCALELPGPNNLDIRLGSLGSVKLVNLLESSDCQIGYMTPQVHDEVCHRIEKTTILPPNSVPLDQKTMEYVALCKGKMRFKFRKLNGKFKTNLAKDRQYLQNKRDADAMCQDLERRYVQNNERSAQLVRFHNNPSNRFDVIVFAESITLKQKLELLRKNRIFIIASNDTSFFSAYIDRNGMAHDTVTREIKNMFDTLCYTAQAACVILPRIMGKEIDEDFDPDGFLTVLALVRLDLKTGPTSEYLKSRMDEVRAEPDVQRKRTMCRALLPYIDWYVQPL